MIVTTDIGNILYRDCKIFDIELVPSWDKLKSDVSAERIDLGTSRHLTGKYWKKGFVEVNLCVPDLDDLGTANTIRLNEIERQANSVFDKVVSSYDGTTYRYSIDSIGTEADTALKCHYVNARILFEVLNVKK